MSEDEGTICPSCKRLIPDRPLEWRRLNTVLVRNSLSRRDNKTYVCNICGGAEAMADYLKISDADARRQLESEL